MLTNRAVVFVVASFLAGLLIGGALVYVFAADAGLVDVTAADRVRAVGATAGGAADPIAVAGGASADRERARRADAGGAGIGMPALPSPAAPRTMPQAQGDGEVHGRVTSNDGKPIAGAVVRAQADTTMPPVPNIDGRGAPPVDRDLAISIAQSRIMLASTREARTDADGRYSLQVPRGVGLVLSAFAEGYYLNSAREVSRYFAGDAADFLGTKLGCVKVRVASPKDLSNCNIYISAKDPDQPDRYVDHWPWFDGDDLHWMRTGNWQLRASIGSRAEEPLSQFTPFASEWKDVAITADSQPTIELQLNEAAAVGGIIHVSGTPDFVEGVYVCVALGDQSRVKKRDELQDAPGNVDYRHEGPSAIGFVASDLKPGKYTIAAVQRAIPDVLAMTVVDVGTGMRRVELDAKDTSQRESINVRILDAAGAPAPQVNLEVAYKKQAGKEQSEFGAYVSRDRNADGSFQLSLSVDAKALEQFSRGAAVTRWITASCEEFGAQTVELPIGAREVLIQFKPTATLEISVSGPRSGEPNAYYIGLESAAQTDPGAPRVEYGLNPNENGKVRFTKLAPGRFRIFARDADARRTGEFSIFSQWIDLKAGPNAIAVTMPPTYSLVVRAVDLPELQNLHLETASRSEHQEGDWRTFSDGEARFDYLPAGEYRLRCWGKDAPPPQWVRIPEQNTIELNRGVGSALSVTFDAKAGAAVEKLGLRSGDLILSIDGQSGKNMRELWALHTLSLTKASTTWHVRRGGQELDVTFDPAPLRDAEDSVRFDESAR